MTSNYYLLARVAREAHSELAGARFIEAVTLRADELRIAFEKEGEVRALVALLKPITGGMWLSSVEKPRGHRSTLSFFEQLSRQSLKGIRISSGDRSIVLEFGDQSLELTFYGKPNAVLRQGSQLISTFRKSESQPVVAPAKLTNAETHADQLREQYPMLGKRLEKEILERVSRSDKSPEVTISDVIQQLESSSETFVYRTSRGLLLSPLELSSIDAADVQRFNTTSDAVQWTVIERGRVERLEARRSRLLERLESALASDRTALAEMRKGSESSNRFEQYTEIANAILSVAYEIPKGAGTVTLLLEAGEREIELDPSASAYENAANFFDRAKRSRESQLQLVKRVDELKRQIPLLEALVQDVTQASDPKQLEQLDKRAMSLGSLVISNQQKAKVSTDPLSQFRQYTVAAGLQVLVGKNAKQNDELTLHVAKKEDVWLHARDVPGSHVVLRTHQLNGAKVPKEAIEQAAEIAAFYSDAKTQTVAPVSYTRKKYVRKPRGAALGTVILEREEVVLVRPRDPQT